MELDLDVKAFETSEDARVGTVVEVALPWPPSVNDYKIPVPNRKTGRIFFTLTKKARQFRDDVRYMLSGVHRFGDSAEILMDIVLHPPDRRRRDADNFNKCVWDALQHAKLFHDDTQVQSYRVTKGAVVKGGMVKVTIWERGRTC